MRLRCLHNERPLRHDRELGRVARRGNVGDREHATGQVTDRVEVRIEQEDFRVRGLTVDNNIQSAELSVTCEALYPRSRLSTGVGLYHHPVRGLRTRGPSSSVLDCVT